MTCPHCGGPVRSLLSGCDRPVCMKREADEERAIDFPAKEG